MSTFWSFWIISLTVICLILVLWVLLANRKVALKDDGSAEHNQTTGHVYDGIEEYDNPLPRWWFNLFIWSVVFSIAYLIWYPGLGAWKGIGGWTSKGQLEKQMQESQAIYESTYKPLVDQSIAELSTDPKALDIGYRLFLDNCALCHGADGGGNFSIPDLSDQDWLYGGEPQNILDSITHGRAGAMPAWGSILKSAGVAQVSEYVLKMSGQEHDSNLAGHGEKIFGQYCVACHGPDGTGSTVFGAPNLTDDVWLYTDDRAGIIAAVAKGLNGEMPAQKEMLREEKIYVLAAYVYSLSKDE